MKPKKTPNAPTPGSELKIHGLHACLALFKARPEDLVRLYLVESRLKLLSDLTRHCVKNRLAYHVITPEEMVDISGALHHEGVCVVAKKKKIPTADELEKLASTAGQWLALENVTNPHNLGAIVRSAAHFGVKGIFLMGESTQWQTGAFYRTAEGGAETVAMIPIENVDELLEATDHLKLQVFATTGRSGSELFKAKLPAKSLFVMGAEGRGLEKETLQKIKGQLKIGGTGLVESLNVSNASAVIMGEWWRQHSKA